jgi:hypothetical protein
MEQKNNGGAAFPDPGRAQSAKQRETLTDTGMTLRDYFAAQALPAILAQSDDGITARAPTGKFSDGTRVADWWAQTAYQIADAMLAERAK